MAMAMMFSFIKFHCKFSLFLIAILYLPLRDRFTTDLEMLQNHAIQYVVCFSVVRFLGKTDEVHRGMGVCCCLSHVCMVSLSLVANERSSDCSMVLDF